MSDPPPTVSVVTVVFNGRAHVADTIGSVLAQEGVALEYWVIDPVGGEFMYRAIIEYDRRRFLARATLPHPGMLMHRRYFEKYGRFDAGYRVSMDYELFLRGVPETGALRVPGVVTRVRAGGVSSRNRQLVIDETLRALRAHGHISAAGELVVRAGYAARGVARKALESAGLYQLFDALRRRRMKVGGHA